MNHRPRQTRALLALNAGLLLALGAVSLAPRAEAQKVSDAARRGRGQYTMVDADFQGVSSAGVIVVDARNREMIALTWDQSRKTLDTLAYRDIDLDERRAKGGGR